MSLIQEFKQHMANLQRAYEKRVKEAEARARVNLANARTKAEKEKAKLQLQRDKWAIKQELYEARVATRNAKEAMERARKEAGDLTLGERLGRIYKGLTKSPRRSAPKKRVVKAPKPKQKGRKREHVILLKR